MQNVIVGSRYTSRNVFYLKPPSLYRNQWPLPSAGTCYPPRPHPSFHYVGVLIRAL